MAWINHNFTKERNKKIHQIKLDKDLKNKHEVLDYLVDDYKGE